MPDVRIRFTGSSESAERASAKTAAGILTIKTSAEKAERASKDLEHSILGVAVASKAVSSRGVKEIGDKAKASERDVNDLRRAIDRLNAAKVGGLGRMGMVGGAGLGLAAAGGGLIAMTAALGPLVGVLAAAPAAVGALGLAFGTFKLASTGVTEALKGNKKALAELTPAQRAFVTELKSLDPILDKLKNTAAQGLFPGVTAGLKAAMNPAFIQSITTAVGGMAKALGDVAHQFGTLVGSSGFLSAFNPLAQAAAGWMRQFGTFATTSFDALTHLGQAAIPLVSWLGQISDRFAVFIDQQIKAGQASGALAHFFDQTRQSLILFGGLLKNTGQVLFDVFRSAFPLGQQLVKSLSDSLGGLHKFLSSDAGKAGLANFFGSIGAALHAILPVVGQVGAALVQVLPVALHSIASVFQSLGPAISGTVQTLKVGLVSAFQDAASAARALAPVLNGVFGNLGRLTSTPVGSQFAALGVTALIFKKALSGLNPAALAALGGVTLLAFGLSALMTTTSGLEGPLKKLADDLNAAGKASSAHKLALNQLAQAQINVATSAHEITAAERSYEQAVKASGRGSLEAKQASDALRQARLNHKRATEDLTTAEKNAATTLEATGKTTRAASKDVADFTKRGHDLRSAYEAATRQVVAGGIGAAGMGASVHRANQEMADKVVRDYADAVRLLARNLGGTKQQADLAAAAVATLTAMLGHLPSRKQIDIYVAMHTSGAAGINVPGISRGSGGPNPRPKLPRAMGGFIPGATGQAVPILAHAGEIVLNPRQQHVLGGPKYLQQLFGFTGDEGPGFASGGIVRGRGGGGWAPIRRAKKSPRSHIRPRQIRAANDLAKKALAAVDGVNLLESDADRAYGQQVREFDISQEVFIVTDAQGNDSVDLAAVQQRLSEIDALLGMRQSMLGLLDDEKAKLEAAIADLRAAIQLLQKAIADEIAAADAQQAEVKRLEASITANRRELTLERRQKKPSQARINSLEDAITKARNQTGPHRDAERAHRSKATELTSQLHDVQNSATDADLNLSHTLPADRRDVQLDMMELRSQRGQVAATRVSQQPAGAAGGDTGGGGLSSVDLGGTSAGPSAYIAGLLELIGRLKGALGIEAVQIPIIGSFAKGTLHVSQSGLAEVHAGEKITSAGTPTPRGRGDSPAPVVHIHFDDAMGWLKDFVRVEAENASDKISVKIGRDSDHRRRSGRF